MLRDDYAREPTFMSSASASAPADLVATELRLPPAAVGAVIALLTAGATVPFIAR